MGNLVEGDQLICCNKCPYTQVSDSLAVSCFECYEKRQSASHYIWPEYTSDVHHHTNTLLGGRVSLLRNE